MSARIVCIFIRLTKTSIAIAFHKPRHHSKRMKAFHPGVFCMRCSKIKFVKISTVRLVLNSLVAPAMSSIFSRWSSLMPDLVQRQKPELCTARRPNCSNFDAGVVHGLAAELLQYWRRNRAWLGGGTAPVFMPVSSHIVRCPSTSVQSHPEMSIDQWPFTSFDVHRPVSSYILRCP